MVRTLLGEAPSNGLLPRLGYGFPSKPHPAAARGKPRHAPGGEKQVLFCSYLYIVVGQADGGQRLALSPGCASVRVWATDVPEGPSTPLWCGRVSCPHGRSSIHRGTRLGVLRGPGEKRGIPLTCRRAGPRLIRFPGRSLERGSMQSRGITSHSLLNFDRRDPCQPDMHPLT